MDLETINRLNPDYLIKSINDFSFRTYGRIIEENIQDVLVYVTKNFLPLELGNAYSPSLSTVEQFESIQRLSHRVYGHLDVMGGVVTGYNQVLNGIEYHQGSETIIAASDCIMVVGHLWDMKNDTFDSALCECFYIPQGTIVECYSTTLHYTPICVSDAGFTTICLLLNGTGDMLNKKMGILKKRNKWFIAHSENIEKVQAGDFQGLTGKMIKINYK
ncbi:DUF4867 family protein [Listeria seeligeri]|uniref:DUF4867 family protein n=1 Tax=Listeria seeligeri TaxID=1640 RepID=A0A7T0MAS6_LISSE|nr:DUF4867 family protein [Listeria seeligeri]EAE1273829.1 DUF4867 family protein [Listeria monocytogenes]QPJ28031.1 DUF4867 family protein [Listeria seeligeri]QPL19377.1 hypothetical protein pLIS400171c [Listeria seeligeri]